MKVPGLPTFSARNVYSKICISDTKKQDRGINLDFTHPMLCKYVPYTQLSLPQHIL